MRIIAGAAGGLSLRSVPGENTRPTTDRVKEALFSRLEAYDVIAGSRVLDLFAGTGSLGLEAASRGAARVDLVDQAHKAVEVLKQNVQLVAKALSSGAGLSVTRSAAKSFLARPEPATWDVVFLDPPYPMPNSEITEILELLAPSLVEGAVVVLERSSRTEAPTVPESLGLFATKKYGETTLYFLDPTP